MVIDLSVTGGPAVLARQATALGVGPRRTRDGAERGVRCRPHRSSAGRSGSGKLSWPPRMRPQRRARRYRGADRGPDPAAGCWPARRLRCRHRRVRAGEPGHAGGAAQCRRGHRDCRVPADDERGLRSRAGRDCGNDHCLRQRDAGRARDHAGRRPDRRPRQGRPCRRAGEPVTAPGGSSAGGWAAGSPSAARPRGRLRTDCLYVGWQQLLAEPDPGPAPGPAFHREPHAVSRAWVTAQHREHRRLGRPPRLGATAGVLDDHRGGRQLPEPPAGCRARAAARQRGRLADSSRLPAGGPGRAGSSSSAARRGAPGCPVPRGSAG